MSKSKHAAPAITAGPVDWTGIRVQRIEHQPAATIFAQGDPATGVMYVERGTVRLSVVSHAGKEAVVAVLDGMHFFGEGCLAGQSQRMATATAMTVCTIVVVDKQEMVRTLHATPAFADRFLTHMLTRNIRIEEDLVDQDVRLGDMLRLRTPYGDFHYRVREIVIVAPDELWVLDTTLRSTLTLISCYPFNYIGPAPTRFIVRAEQIPNPPPTHLTAARGVSAY